MPCFDWTLPQNRVNEGVSHGAFIRRAPGASDSSVEGNARFAFRKGTLRRAPPKGARSLPGPTARRPYRDLLALNEPNVTGQPVFNLRLAHPTRTKDDHPAKVAVYLHGVDENDWPAALAHASRLLAEYYATGWIARWRDEEGPHG